MVSGSGTSGDPYILSSFSDLELLGTSPYTLSKYYQLGADIDASPTQDPGYNGGAGWSPRGTSGTPFSGSFDGDERTISGLYINLPTTNNVGLFAYAQGIIKDVIITASGGSIVGQDNVGALVGSSTDTLTIQNCNSTTNVTGANHVGGIIGYLPYGTGVGIVDACDVNASISGTSYVGGVLGRSENSSGSTTTKYCTMSGQINATSQYVGGIVGYLRGKIQYCSTNSNLIFNLSSDINNVGGICGYIRYSSNINDCINNSNVVGGNSVGGILGTHYSREDDSTIVNCSNYGDINGTTRVGGIVGDWEAYGGFTYIRDCIVSCTITATSSYVGGCAGIARREISNIDCSNNLIINSGNTQDYIGGIVGYSDYAINISDCIVETNITGRDYIGGIIGGTYSNTSKICTIDSCGYTGTINARNRVGGIIGNNLMSNGSCAFTQCFSRGSISGTSYVGGVAGYTYRNFTNCYSQSNISGSDNVGGFIGLANTSILTNCYSSGSVTGTSSVGGLVGAQLISSAISCYWDTDTSGQPTSALGTGKSTFEMKTENTFSNWDFDTLWDITPMDGLEYFSGEENEILLGAMAVQPTPANVSLEGYDFSLLMGSGVIGAVGNLLISGLTGEVLVEMVIVAPSGEVFMSGINPYLPQEGDIELYDLTPKKIAKKFVSYVKFKLKIPDDNAFLIETAKAKMDNETIPITITRNGTAVNTCQMTIDTNHLRDGWKKLDITIIIEGNSNQFRRYIRIL